MGPQQQPAPMLATQILAFLHYIRAERGLSASTVETYGRSLDRFGRWAAAGGLEDYLRPRPDELSAYVRFLHEEGLAPASVAGSIVALKMLYRFIALDRDGGVPAAVELLEAPALPERLPVVLSLEEVERLLAATQPCERYYLRDVAVLEVLYATGLRASELCGLCLRDLDLAGAFVRVVHGKGGKSRLVPLGRSALKALRAYLQDRPRLVWKEPAAPHVFVARGGKPFTREQLWGVVKKYARRAGLHAKVGVHSLRHTLATHLHAGGADLRVIQELLGHSSIKTTQLCAHVDNEQVRAAHRRFHPHGATRTPPPVPELLAAPPPERKNNTIIVTWLQGGEQDG